MKIPSQGRLLRLILVYALFIFTHSNISAQPEYDAATRLIPDDLDGATSRLDALYEQAVKSGNDTLEAKVLYLKGVVQTYRGNYYIAADYYERVLTHEEYLSNQPIAKEGILNNLGICYEYIEDLGRAFEAYDASLAMAIERDDSSGIVMSWINMGLLATNQDNLDVGEKYLRLAEAYCQGKPQESYNQALVYNNLAHLLEKQKGSHREIVRYLSKAAATFEAAGDTLNWMLTLSNLMCAYIIKKEELPLATQCLSKLDQLIGQVTPPAWLEALIYRSKGDYWIAHKAYDKAYATLAKALTLYKSQLNVQEMRRTYRRMLYVRAAQGDFKAYAQLDAQSHDDLAATAQSRSRARYEELAILHDVKRKEATIMALDDRVRWLDQSLAKAIRTTRIQAFFLLLLVVLVGLLVGFTRQYRDLQWLKKALFRRNRELDALKLQRSTTPILDGEPAPSSTDEETSLRQLFTEIDHQMKRQQWYLNPQFGLKDLSAHLNTNVAYASKAINLYSGSNFSQYLNAFRIQAAKAALESAANAQDNPAIATIALQSGFNSYNTFHRVFRAETGLTPSQYFKLLAQKSRQ